MKYDVIQRYGKKTIVSYYSATVVTYSYFVSSEIRTIKLVLISFGFWTVSQRGLGKTYPINL